MKNEVLQQLHNDLCADLERIADRFATRSKITLIIRHPDKPQASVYLTDDTLDEAVAAARALEDAAQHVFPAETVSSEP